VNVTVSHLGRAGVTLLPVAAFFLVGLLLLPHLDTPTSHFFLLLLVVSSAVVLLGELTLLLFLQRLRLRRYRALIDACQEALAGNADCRPHVQGDPALLPLARLLNTMLDTIALAHKHSQQQQGAILRHQHEQAEWRTQVQTTHAAQAHLTTQLQNTQTAHAHLSAQVQHLLRALRPVLQGDLRVRADVLPGEVGLLAEVCNTLMEETITLVRWTRSSSQQFSTQTRTLLTGTITLAQQVEDQLLHFSQMIEATEQMMACLHHINTTLQLSLDSMCTLQTQFQHQQHTTQGQTDLLRQLEHTARYHLQLLTDLAQTTRSHATLAQALIAQCSTLAQGLHQSSIGVLQTAEQLTAVAWMAEQREEALRTLQLPEPPLPEAASPPHRAGEKRQMPSTTPSSPLPPEQGEEHFQAHLV
jgi:hypothetical protein